MDETPKNPSSLADFAAPLKVFSDLLNQFLNPATKEAGEVFAEHIRLFRLKRQIQLLEKATAILKQRGLKPKAVNLRVLAPLLETASIEEEESMSERWASLLSSAADPENKSAQEVSFVEILRQLAPPHAFLLDVFYEQVKRDSLGQDKWKEEGYVLSDLKSFLRDEVPQFDVAIDNLLRLNLVAIPTVRFGMANGHELRTPVTSANILCATSLGHAFVTACGHGRTPRNTAYGVPGDSTSNVFSTKDRPLQLWSKEAEDAMLGRFIGVTQHLLTNAP